MEELVTQIENTRDILVALDLCNLHRQRSGADELRERIKQITIILEDVQADFALEPTVSLAVSEARSRLAEFVTIELQLATNNLVAAYQFVEGRQLPSAKVIPSIAIEATPEDILPKQDTAPSSVQDGSSSIATTALSRHKSSESRTTIDGINDAWLDFRDSSRPEVTSCGVRRSARSPGPRTRPSRFQSRSRSPPDKPLPPLPIVIPCDHVDPGPNQEPSRDSNTSPCSEIPTPWSAISAAFEVGLATIVRAADRVTEIDIGSISTRRPLELECTTRTGFGCSSLMQLHSPVHAIY